METTINKSTLTLNEVLFVTSRLRGRVRIICLDDIDLRKLFPIATFTQLLLQIVRVFEQKQFSGTKPPMPQFYCCCLCSV